MSTDTIKNAVKRREARKAAQEAAKEQANKDAALRKADVVREQASRVQTPKAARASRKEMTIKAQEEAEKQAAIDASKLPPAPEEIAEKYELKPGEVPPLAVLNARAKLAAQQTRDAAREIANAAGKAAFETAQGRIARGPHKRYVKMRTAEAALAAATEKQD